MNDFAIDFEWVDPLGAKGPELRATWARLSIVVDGYPVTRVYDEQFKTVRDAVYLPLYPLAEWLVAHWWPLWNEAGPSPSADRPGYDARHSLVSAREGYALPPLRIQPAGSIALLSWSPERLPFHRLEFTGGGNLWLETRLVKTRLSSLVDAVVSRLEANAITDSLLQQDWVAIQSADADEEKFCECAGALGLDPYSLDDSQQREIEHAGQRLPEEILSEFFRAARRRELKADADKIHEALAQAQSNPADLTSLKDLRRVVAEWHEPAGTEPWEQGYAFARRLRSHLGLDGTLLKSIGEVRAAVGRNEKELIPILTKILRRPMPFAALIGINERSSPAFVLREALPPSELFHFCRALFEYLRSSTHRSALITDAETEQQKRNRAFAAEFLAPASALRTRVRTRIVTQEETEELAQEFGVSAYVIEHQLDNHDIASVRRT